MKYSFSLAHLTALKCPTPELVYIAAEAGYDYISPRVINLGIAGEGNYDLASQPELLKETIKALDETGLKVHDIELFRIIDKTDIESYKPAMEVAAKLGAKHILSSVWTADKTYYTEEFGKLCASAREFGLNVQLEFVTWAEVCNLKEAATLLRAVNASNAGVMIDTLHAYRSRVSPDELAECPKEWFQFCHICDGPLEIPATKPEMVPVGRDARLYIGEGAINIAAYLKKMPDNMVYSIELPNLQRVSEYGYKEHAKRCIDTAKAYLNSNM